MKYLENKDLLHEIELSKLSYCSYDPGYEKYDIALAEMPEVLEPDTIYRIQTTEHIPPNTKLNFPAFIHVILENGSVNTVLKSHHKGDSFSTNHGRLTPKLGSQLLLLVNHIASASDYRSSQYLECMKSAAILRLTEKCLRFDEVKSNQAFAYLTSTVNNAFYDQFAYEKRMQKIQDSLIFNSGDNYVPDDMITENESEY